jgi:hypothetical protein
LDHIKELESIIYRAHDAKATHVRSVPVKESFNGNTVWDGTVEVFRLHDHPRANHVYAWSHDTDDPKYPKRHVTVLHMGAVTSPQLAVRAAIVQEFRDAYPQA